MKKYLLGLTMGAMVFSVGQVTSAEASFSSNTPTCNTQVKYDWSAQSQGKNSDSLSAIQKQMLDQVYSQLSAAGFKQSIEKQEIQKPVVPTKKVEAKPVAKKPEQSPKPVAAKPVAQKPATNTKPVAAKPAPAPATTSKPVVAQKPAPTPVAAQSGSISAIEQQVLTLTNQERAKGGLKPLATDSALMSTARAKSSDMSKNNYFSHTSPTLGSPFDQMKAKGIQYKAAAENIAMGQRTAAEVVKGWMESPGHRANIMNGNFTHIGIGYDAQGNYWTQQFIQK
ncbi:MAG: CAP domain-containing protein [Paenisporosarcina sp.]